jgi:AraC-like DNA-binding protein
MNWQEPVRIPNSESLNVGIAGVLADMCNSLLPADRSGHLRPENPHSTPVECPARKARKHCFNHIPPGSINKNLHLTYTRVNSPLALLQSSMNIFIKYMVSLRCKGAVLKELNALGIKFKKIDYGMIQLPERLPAPLEKQLRHNLKSAGMEMLSVEESAAIQNAIRAVETLSDNPARQKAKDEIGFVAGRSKTDPVELSILFAQVKGISIQKYILQQKMETAKVWLIYSDKSIADLSGYFNFSSPETFSRAFKKFTGITPLFYRKIKRKRALISVTKDSAGPL